MDLYELLGVDRSATSDEIKRAYRAKALEFHPDRNQGSENSNNQFKLINEANDVFIERGALPVPGELEQCRRELFASEVGLHAVPEHGGGGELGCLARGDVVEAKRGRTVAGLRLEDNAEQAAAEVVD